MILHVCTWNLPHAPTGYCLAHAYLFVTCYHSNKTVFTFCACFYCVYLGTAKVLPHIQRKLVTENAVTVTKDQTKKMKNQMVFWTNDETKLLYLRLLINKIPTAWKGYQHWKFLASYGKHHPGLLQAQLFTKCASSSCLHVYDTATLSKYNLFSKTSICRVKFTILGTHTVRC